jgi:membrane protease YdiL (CAAX protease family)
LLVVILASAGIGAFGSYLLARIDSNIAQMLSGIALWTGLLGAVVYAMSRAIPASLLAIRAPDILWGVGLAAALRYLGGILSGADSATFPSLAIGPNSNALREFFTELGLRGVGGPLMEELYFRAVLLVVVFQLLRRSTGSIGAGIAASFVSMGAFVCIHALYAPVTLMEGLQLSILALACSSLVLLTGRMWGAVILHVSYNVSFLVLQGMGTLYA